MMLGAATSSVIVAKCHEHASPNPEELVAGRFQTFSRSFGNDRFWSICIYNVNKVYVPKLWHRGKRVSWDLILANDVCLPYPSYKYIFLLRVCFFLFSSVSRIDASNTRRDGDRWSSSGVSWSDTEWSLLGREWRVWKYGNTGSYGSCIMIILWK